MPQPDPANQVLPDDPFLRRPRPRLLPPRRARLLSVLAFTGIYATCFALIKAGRAFAPPLWLGGRRALSGGGAFLGLLGRAPGPRRWQRPGLLALAAFSTTIGFGAGFRSPGRTGAGLAAVLGNMQPLVAVVLAAVFWGERLTSRAA